MGSAIIPLLLVSTLNAATLRVPADYTTIQEAINEAAEGDRVSVAAGQYAEAIVMREGIALDGAGWAVTVIIGSSYKPVVTGASHSRISGFTIVGSADDDVDGILCPNLVDFEISRNVIRDCTWSGISSEGSSLVVANNRILRNRVAGVFCVSPAPSPVVIVNNTILGNQNEAGINIWNDASALVVNNIITANTGYGGIYVAAGGTVTLVSNDVWGNTCWLLPPAEYVGCEAGETDISADPLFTDPDHGDYRLQAGSPCIDAGTAEGAPTVDLEGLPRPCGAGFDMGAYERCGEGFSRGDANADGNLNIADAVFVLGYLFGSAERPSCVDAADANDDGETNIADAITMLGHLFGGAGPLPDPFGACGTDPTGDALVCAAFPPCAR